MIFGTFQDIPVPDILSLVGRQTGRFQVSGHPSLGRADMFFSEGHLLALCVHGRWVPEVLQVRDSVIELLMRQEGEFLFERGELPACGTLYRLAVEHLLLASMAAIDEIESFRMELPNAQTYFRLIQQNVGWLDADLALFWEVAGGALQIGTNAISLAAMVGMSVDRVCLYLYKLRLAGWIVPMRPGTRVLNPWPATPGLSPELPKLADSVPVWITSPVNPVPASHTELVSGVALCEPPSSEPQGIPVDLRRVRVAKPTVGVLRGLMNRLALAFGRE